MNWNELSQEFARQSAGGDEAGRRRVEQLAREAELSLVQLLAERDEAAEQTIDGLIEFLHQLERPQQRPFNSLLCARILLRGGRLLDRIGRKHDALANYLAAIAALNGSSQQRLRAIAMLEAGDLLRRLGRSDAARRQLGDCVEFAVRHGLVEELADALNNLGITELDSGAVEEARRQFETAIETLAEDGAPRVLGHVYNNLGVLHCIQGRPENGLVALRRALSYRERDDEARARGLAETYHNMGMAAQDLGRYDEAESYYLQGQQHAIEANNPVLQANLILGRAELNRVQRRFELAGFFAKRAETLYQRLNDRLGIAESLKIQGAALIALNNSNSARPLLERALDIFKSHQFPLGEAETLAIIGRGLVSIPERTRQDMLNQAAAIYRRLGNETKARELDAVKL